MAKKRANGEGSIRKRMDAGKVATPRATIPRQVSGSLKMFSARHKQNARQN